MRQLKITKQITQRPDESINRYFQEINKYSMITAEEEVELTVRIRNGDDLALEKLVLANLRFVISVAKQYQNKGLSFADLINEGNVGLVKAAKKFDETRGFKFISYAVWWIRQSIIQAISEHTRIVRLPLNRLASINKITKAIPYLEQELGREPTDDELAVYLELSYEDVKAANEIKSKQISFDKPLGSDGDFSLYDLVPSEELLSPDNGLMLDSESTNISRALLLLSKREATVLTMLYGLGSTPVYSLHDVALKYEMTSERIRQIKNSGIKKMKTMLVDNPALVEN